MPFLERGNSLALHGVIISAQEERRRYGKFVRQDERIWLDPSRNFTDKVLRESGLNRMDDCGRIAALMSPEGIPILFVYAFSAGAILSETTRPELASRNETLRILRESVRGSGVEIHPTDITNVVDLHSLKPLGF